MKIYKVESSMSLCNFMRVETGVPSNTWNGESGRKEPGHKQTGASGRSLLGFDVVIATRNRPQALALSIPLILGQSRQPRKLIVVDSSDDHAPVAEVVAEATADWGGTVIIERSSPGLPHQRNVGLRNVESDVVMFPDDDSLFYPGASEAIMRVYELDSECRIAGVCAADALEAPDGALAIASYDMTLSHKLRAKVMRYRNWLGRRINALSPTLYLGTLLRKRGKPFDWFGAENCVLVEYMTGYRMTFRAAAIRAQGFDETLQAYALSEDLDASFAVMKHGILVGALNARIHHHKFPGGRGDPYTLGMMRVLNRSYVVLKHLHDAGLSKAEAYPARTLIRHFCLLSVFTCLGGLFTPNGRERLCGVLAALGGVRAMLTAPRGELSIIYHEIQGRVLANRVLATT